MTSTYDHRIIQGAESGQFLKTVEEFLQGESRPTACTATSPPARPARLRAARRPGARSRDARPDARAHGAIPAGVLRIYVRGRDARRRAAAPARDLLRHDRLRDRAHLRPRASASGCAGDRVRRATAAADRRRAARAAARAPHRGRGLERFLHKAYLGQKQFSIEGLDMTVPMLDFTIELAAAHGAREVVIGMAHRGRLNVLAHTSAARTRRSSPSSRASDDRGRRRRSRGRHRRRQVPPRRAGGVRTDPTGGESITRHARRPTRATSRRRPGRRGRARAEQTDRRARGHHDPSRRAAGPAARRRRVPRPGRRRRDAQPAGARRLRDRRHAAPDHRTTRSASPPTPRRRARRATRATSRRASTSRSSTSTPTTRGLHRGRAAGDRVPRAEFGHDVVIDLVGYRRFGHNEPTSRRTRSR
jgi:hypothetical protein